MRETKLFHLILVLWFLNLLFFISFLLFESKLLLLSNSNTVTLFCSTLYNSFYSLPKKYLAKFPVTQNCVYKLISYIEIYSFCIIGGLLSFNIRLGELERYQPMIEQLEKEGKWLNVAKKTIPQYQRDDMPKISLSCLQNPEALMRQLTR